MASDAVVTLVVDATGAQAQINADLNRIVNSAERSAPAINLNVVIDQRTVNNTFNQIVGRLDETNRRAGDTDDRVGRLGATFSRMGSAALSAVTGAARIGAIGSLAAAALPAVGALVGLLANIAPAAAAGVTAFVGLKAATLSLKVGLIGVEDALSQVFAAEPDAEALAKALERLAPEARAFVLEMQKLRPALDDIRLDVQNRLFQDLDAQLARTATVSLPVLRNAALDFAGTFNTVGKNVAASAAEISESGALGRALRSGGIAFNNLARIPGQLLSAITRLAVGGGPLLIRLTDRIADVADSLTVKLNQAASSGALQDAINEAAATLRALGRVASNVFGALGNVMDIAADAGGGLFGSLEKVTQSLEDLTGTDGFRQTLTALITTGQTLVSNVLPLLQRAFEIIGPVIAELAPPVQELLNLIGDRLLQTLDVLAPSFALLGSAVGNLITAVGPVIDLFFTLINAILPVLTPLLDAVNQIVIALTPVIQVLAEQLGEALVPVIEALIPVITLLAEFIAQVVVALAPLVAELLPVVIDLFTRLLPPITFVIEKLTPLIALILEFAVALVEELVTAIGQVIDWVGRVADKFKELATDVVSKVLLPSLQVLKDFLNGDFTKAWQGAQRVVANAGILFVETIQSAKNEISRLLSGLVLDMTLKAQRAVLGLINGFADGAGRLQATVNRLLLDAVSRVDNFAGELYKAGQNLVLALARGIISQIGSAVEAMQSAVGRVAALLPHSPAKTGPFSGRGYPLYSGHAIMDSLAAGITARAGAVSDAMQAALTGSPLGAPAIAGLGSAQGAFGRAVTGALSTTVAAPNVSVYLGNELLTDRMRVVVDDKLTDRDRQASQGVRF